MHEWWPAQQVIHHLSSGLGRGVQVCINLTLFIIITVSRDDYSYSLYELWPSACWQVALVSAPCRRTSKGDGREEHNQSNVYGWHQGSGYPRKESAWWTPFAPILLSVKASDQCRFKWTSLEFSSFRRCLATPIRPSLEVKWWILALWVRVKIHLYPVYSSMN